MMCMFAFWYIWEIKWAFKPREWLNEGEMRYTFNILSIRESSNMDRPWTPRGLTRSSLLYPGCYFDSIITEGEISCLGNRRGAAVSLPRSDRHPGVLVGGTQGSGKCPVKPLKSPQNSCAPCLGSLCLHRFSKSLFVFPFPCLTFFRILQFSCAKQTHSVILKHPERFVCPLLDWLQIRDFCHQRKCLLLFQNSWYLKEKLVNIYSWWVCFFIRFGKCSIASVSQQWMLCSEWVPSEWESKQLIKSSQ